MSSTRACVLLAVWAAGVATAAAQDSRLVSAAANHDRGKVLALIAEGEADALARLGRGFPAGAVAVFDFAILDWGGIDGGSGSYAIFFNDPNGICFEIYAGAMTVTEFRQAQAEKA